LRRHRWSGSTQTIRPSPHIHWPEESFYIPVKQFLGHFALHKPQISKLVADIVQLFDGFFCFIASVYSLKLL